MKKLFTILILLAALPCFATDYYVSPSGSDSNNGTSQGTPWKTLSRVQTFLNGPAQPGDRVLFQRGQVWNGTLLVSTIWGYNGKSGTRANPIYIGAYGTGAAPRITGATTRGSFTFNGVKNYIIDGLNFEDTSFDPSDKVTAAPTACGIRLGAYQEIDTDSITIKNCSFSNIGLAVVMDGSYNKMDSCTVTNMKNVKSTYSTTYPGNDDDYGANPLTIYGNFNEITNCYISGGWAESWDYGWNGGAFEMFDNANNNRIMYNTIYDCGGIAEFGAYVSGATAQNNLIAYNLIIDCGNLSWVNFGGTFAIQASNIQYINNVIVESPNSRFSGPNTGAGVVTPSILAKISPEPDLLAFSSGSTVANVYTLKNNIFYLATGQKIVRSATVASKTIHENNIYRFVSGSANMTLNANELITTAQIWKSQTGNPVTWDYDLIAGSPAIEFGQLISGLIRDKRGIQLVGKPEAGIYEYGVSTPPPPAGENKRLELKSMIGKGFDLRKQ